MKLAKDDFLNVVANTPLVSIDLIVQSPKGEFLLGHRVNRPAQGVWFVPGGRVRKDETLRDALARIVQTELGNQMPVEGWRWRGVFEHFYPDNFSGTPGISTHYVVLAAELKLNTEELALQFDPQHEALTWASPEELLARDDVHPNTKAYFDSTPSFLEGYENGPTKNK